MSPKRTKAPKPETDPARRKRYGEALTEIAWKHQASEARALAAVFFATIHAALPGIQDRNAAYQTRVYETCFRAAKKAVRRLKV